MKWGNQLRTLILSASFIIVDYIKRGATTCRSHEYQTARPAMVQKIASSCMWHVFENFLKALLKATRIMSSWNRYLNGVESMQLQLWARFYKAKQLDVIRIWYGMHIATTVRIEPRHQTRIERSSVPKRKQAVESLKCFPEINTEWLTQIETVCISTLLPIRACKERMSIKHSWQIDI